VFSECQSTRNSKGGRYRNDDFFLDTKTKQKQKIQKHHASIQDQHAHKEEKTNKEGSPIAWSRILRKTENNVEEDEEDVHASEDRHEEDGC